MMTQPDAYPEWICCDCGEKHGRPSRREACMHIGSPCGWCGRDDVPVTQPRDYGWPKLAEGIASDPA